MPDSKRVIPIESNPEIFNSLAHNIGLTPVLAFQDVYSLTDPDLLAFLPRPAMAVTMLFPITKTYEEYRKNEDLTHDNNSKGSLWFKQTVGNGCGFYAILHILANLPRDLIIENLILNKLLLLQISEDTAEDEVTMLVELLEQNIELDSNYGNQGQTEAPNAEEQVEFHFISFVKGKDGHLYELDGRRTGPVDLGPCEDADLINDQKLLEKIQFYMDNTEESQRNNFALMALVPSL